MSTALPVEPDLVAVRSWLAARPGEITPHRVAEALRSTGRPVGDQTVLATVDLLRTEVDGAGPLAHLLALPGVTDVVVNGPAGVLIDRGRGLEPVEVALRDESAVRRLAQRLAAAAGRRLDDSVPYVDARLADGTRLHAVLAPVARPGTLISLRVPSRTTLPLEASVPRDLVPLVRRIVERRLAFLVTGGTGSGKTTLLAALLGLVPPTERLLVVEDSSELRPEHPHVVALEARPANVEGAGAVTVQTLVRQALRMRPDRLVIGEVRGPEVVDLLASLNTGHEGGCGTLHANSARDVPARLEALALSAGLSREATHAQIAAGLHIVLHVDRATRQVAEIALPIRSRSGLVRMRLAVTCRDGVVETGPAADRLTELLAGAR